MKNQALFFKDLMLQVDSLQGRGFTITWKIKSFVLLKIKVKKIKCRLLQFLFGALRVNGENMVYNMNMVCKVSL